ncbi:MAG: hypothetical protein QXP35_02865 [Candidatus Micrarchaeaceae archaeon]|nr:hypothetical protein [Candidatus Marsarchaeota archaeon]
MQITMLQQKFWNMESLFIGSIGIIAKFLMNRSLNTPLYVHLVCTKY